MRSDILKILVSVGLCYAVAFVSSRFEPGIWYQALAKPAWTPPSWVFAPVWTILYTIMGLAAWLVWRQEGIAAAGLPLSVFVLQLILNGLWTWIFFGQRNIGLAFAEIVILWILILVTLILFWKRQALAGIMLLPYLLWVGFAAILNYAIWRLNL
jgi:tryptophan-rich sensory protein